MVYSRKFFSTNWLEWRNWQTHGTQNPASFTGYEGSTPSSSTKAPKRLQTETIVGLWRRAVFRIALPGSALFQSNRSVKSCKPAVYHEIRDGLVVVFGML